MLPVFSSNFGFSVHESVTSIFTGEGNEET